MTGPLPPDDPREQAIAWVVRTVDPDFVDWPSFEAWLAASPANADAYRHASVAEADMVEALAASSISPASTPAPAYAPARRLRWPLWGGRAIAAALLFSICYRQALSPPIPPSAVYETSAGTRREVALADGSRIILNGASRLSISGSGARSARLERGEGLFEVRHRPDAPFRVEVGDATIVDVGTVFDVVRESAGTRVAVAEGAIDWRGKSGGVRVPAGKRLRTTDGETVAIGPVSEAAVGGWARGQMVFEGEPLRAAAADLARSLGVDVRVPPGLGERPVRASVRLDGDAATVLGRFATLLDLRLHRDARGWRLAATP